MRLYDLRHTSVSLLLDLGIPPHIAPFCRATAPMGMRCSHYQDSDRPARWAVAFVQLFTGGHGR